MSVPNVVVAVLSDEDLDLLPPLVDEFVSTHPSLRFREAYWSALREWLGQRLKDENTLALTAKVGGALWKGMQEWFLAQGIRDIELYTELGNKLSTAFWERRGFTVFLVRRRRHLTEGP